MGSKCHAHIVPGHREIEELRRALATDEGAGGRRDWRELVPFGADVLRELEENVTTWHIPSPEELGDVLGDEEATSATLIERFGEFASVLDSGEVWVVHSAGSEQPITLVVGMSFD